MDMNLAFIIGIAAGLIGDEIGYLSGKHAEVKAPTPPSIAIEFHEEFDEKIEPLLLEMKRRGLDISAAEEDCRKATTREEMMACASEIRKLAYKLPINDD